MDPQKKSKTAKKPEKGLTHQRLFYILKEFLPPTTKLTPDIPLNKYEIHNLYQEIFGTSTLPDLNSPSFLQHLLSSSPKLSNFPYPHIHETLKFLYLYKTLPCTKDACTENSPNKTRCHDFHSPKDRRRNLINFTYSPIPCDSVIISSDYMSPLSWGDSSDCPRGEKCIYAHTRNEFCYHSEIYKTEKCKQLHNDLVLYKICPFFHSRGEHRVRSRNFGVAISTSPPINGDSTARKNNNKNNKNNNNKNNDILKGVSKGGGKKIVEKTLVTPTAEFSTEPIKKEEGRKRNKREKGKNLAKSKKGVTFSNKTATSKVKGRVSTSFSINKNVSEPVEKEETNGSDEFMSSIWSQDMFLHSNMAEVGTLGKVMPENGNYGEVIASHIGLENAKMECEYMNFELSARSSRLEKALKEMENEMGHGCEFFKLADVLEKLEQKFICRNCKKGRIFYCIVNCGHLVCVKCAYSLQNRCVYCSSHIRKLLCCYFK